MSIHTVCSVMGPCAPLQAWDLPHFSWGEGVSSPTLPALCSYTPLSPSAWGFHPSVLGCVLCCRYLHRANSTLNSHLDAAGQGLPLEALPAQPARPGARGQFWATQGLPRGGWGGRRYRPALGPVLGGGVEGLSDLQAPSLPPFQKRDRTPLLQACPALSRSAQGQPLTA